MMLFRHWLYNWCCLISSGLYLDAEAAMDFVLHRSDLDQRQIYLFGRSLGGAVAIFLASSPLYAQHICAMIVENTFTSIPAMGQHIFRTSLLSYIPHWCFKNLVSGRDVIVTHFYQQYTAIKVKLAFCCCMFSESLFAVPIWCLFGARYAVCMRMWICGKMKTTWSVYRMPENIDA